MTEPEMCFFHGHVAGYLNDPPDYLVDGVAVNGVSRGASIRQQSAHYGSGLTLCAKSGRREYDASWSLGLGSDKRNSLLDGAPNGSKGVRRLARRAKRNPGLHPGVETPNGATACLEIKCRRPGC